MPKTVDQFRNDFREFANDTDYPDEAVTHWLNAAYIDCTAAVFGNKLDEAAELFTAHFLVLGRRAEIESKFGRVPGSATGVVNSRSVDKASVAYDSSMISDKAAGFWNLTQYGLRFWWILRTRRLGPVYRVPRNLHRVPW